MSNPNKAKAPHRANGQGLQETKIKPSQYTLRSTATEAQRMRILEALRTGPKTSYDLRRMGCYQCPTRVLELRRMGYQIHTERVTLYDRDGYAHRGAARYHLAGEPDGERS